MKDLIERLERASGPDRGLDGEIYCLDPVVAPLWPHWTLFQREELTPRYTGSLDAAMTLLPEGTYLQILIGPNRCEYAWTGEDLDCDDHHGDHKYPPIAACISILKALHSRSVEEPKE